MPVPFSLLAVTGATLIGGAFGSKVKEANDTMKDAQRIHKQNMDKLQKENELTCEEMDKLGRLELEISSSFGKFEDAFAKIHNKPKFIPYSKDGVTLPTYDGEKLKEVSVGAEVLLGALCGAGLGVAGGYAAAGATAAAVMVFGTASTGTPIITLSGAALTNATLAALGGGSLAAGGGGMAAGAAVLGTAAWGAGLIIGCLIFNLTGKKLSEKADEAWDQMGRAEVQINKICAHLTELRKTAANYYVTLSTVNEIYQLYLNGLISIVDTLRHRNWSTFTEHEKMWTENTVLLVGLLYNMCKVELVLKAENENDMNSINKDAVQNSINSANAVMADRFQNA